MTNTKDNKRTEMIGFRATKETKKYFKKLKEEHNITLGDILEIIAQYNIKPTQITTINTINNLKHAIKENNKKIEQLTEIKEHLTEQNKQLNKLIEEQVLL